MEKYHLVAKKREEVRKEVAGLRKSGFIPGVIYGSDVKENILIKFPTLEIEKIYQLAGVSSIIEMEVEGEKKPVDVLIKDVSFDPISMKIEHIDFYKIKEGQKIETMVEIEFVGEAPAVKELGGTFMATLNEIHIKCLPKDLVSKITVDISGLKSFNDSIYVKDLNISTGIEILNELNSPVAAVLAPQAEEVEEKKPEVVMPEVVGEKKKEEADGKAEKKETKK
jgi:large subunit ribosomal protein L25